MYKRCAVVFNLDNPSHLELYLWCMEQSTNFSEYVRSLLHLQKELRRLPVGAGSIAPLSSFHQESNDSRGDSIDDNASIMVSDEEAMGDFI